MSFFSEVAEVRGCLVIQSSDEQWDALLFRWERPPPRAGLDSRSEWLVAGG